MFDNLTSRFSSILKKISNRGRLTESNIKSTLKDVKIALLEADVALPVVKKFLLCIKNSTIGNKINNTLSPGQEFIKIVKKELILSMGEKNNSLNLSTSPPAIILIIGTQGAGKTTSVGKIGKFILEKTNKKKILSVSIDIYRPEAIKQLEIISRQARIDFFPSNKHETPINITHNALNYAKLKLYDILIIDTAGRLHNNNIMMKEIQDIHQLVHPIETLFVIDAMTGQDAIQIAKNFNKILPISGYILTKTDGDARGGVALSIRYITQKPIKFIGTGEKLHSFEAFDPDTLASRILGMENIISIIENIEKKVDKNKIKKLTTNLKHKKNFDLNDFLIQIKQIKDFNNNTNITNKFPKNRNFTNMITSYFDTKTIKQTENIINSMTINERKNPEIIKCSRKKRISLGSGIKIQDINQILKKFDNIKNIMKKIKKNGISKFFSSIKNIIPKGIFN